MTTKNAPNVQIVCDVLRLRMRALQGKDQQPQNAGGVSVGMSEANYLANGTPTEGSAYSPVMCSGAL
jgi:hypothetical protein